MNQPQHPEQTPVPGHPVRIQEADAAPSEGNGLKGTVLGVVGLALLVAAVAKGTNTSIQDVVIKADECAVLPTRDPRMLRRLGGTGGADGSGGMGGAKGSGGESGASPEQPNPLAKTCRFYGPDDQGYESADGNCAVTQVSSPNAFTELQGIPYGEMWGNTNTPGKIHLTQGKATVTILDPALESDDPEDESRTEVIAELDSSLVVHTKGEASLRIVRKGDRGPNGEDYFAEAQKLDPRIQDNDVLGIVKAKRETATYRKDGSKQEIEVPEGAWVPVRIAKTPTKPSPHSKETIIGCSIASTAPTSSGEHGEVILGAGTGVLLLQIARRKRRFLSKWKAPWEKKPFVVRKSSTVTEAV